MGDYCAHPTSIFIEALSRSARAHPGHILGYIEGMVRFRPLDRPVRNVFELVLMNESGSMSAAQEQRV